MNTIGPGYLDLAFQWANEADPDALLFMNTMNTVRSGVTADAVHDLASDLLNRGVPIHGVGLQFHLRVDEPPDLAEMRYNMNRLSDLGLILHITEMDVRIPQPATESSLLKQANIFRDVLKVCLEVSGCRALVTCGVSDLTSWIPNVWENWGSALPFDETYAPKPAYGALFEILRDH